MEGGDWDGPETDRLELFRAVLPHVNGIDIELSSHEIVDQVIASAHDAGKTAIVSNHNFNETPSNAELERMVAEAKGRGADLVKLSAMATAPEDLVTLAKFTIDNAQYGVIVIAMGPLGSMSRVFFPALGSRLTYASNGPRHTVSGQLNFVETFEMLRKFYPEFNERKIIELGLDGA